MWKYHLQNISYFCLGLNSPGLNNSHLYILTACRLLAIPIQSFGIDRIPGKSLMYIETYWPRHKQPISLKTCPSHQGPISLKTFPSQPMIKITFIAIPFLARISLQIFAHDKTAELLCHVPKKWRKMVVIGSLKFGWAQNEISITSNDTP